MCAERTARIAQLDGDIHELERILGVIEHRNIVVDLQYFMLSDECVLPKHQSASGGMCSEEMVQGVANAIKNVVTSITDLNRHAAHVPKRFEITFLISSLP